MHYALNFTGTSYLNSSFRLIFQIPEFVVGRLMVYYCFLNSMAMSTQVQAKVSKTDTIVLGGNMALRRGLGGGSMTMVMKRQLSPISSIELVTMIGLRSILSLQTSRYFFPHVTKAHFF